MESSILNSIGIDPGIIVIVMMGIMIFVLLYMVRVSMNALHEALSHFHEGKGCRVP